MMPVHRDGWKITTFTQPTRAELHIETLTGTCFQLRVSTFETVLSVKAKIQRLEGIPVAQQHLIWNSLELDNEYCLHDYSITEGCTLKLVLAMRGGPINTRRVTMCDSIKEAPDSLDSKKDELWEKSLTNKEATFLLYQKGDQLNIFRVVDRGDGTLTPVSKTRSGFIHNVYTEEEEESVVISSGQLALENSITMNKMKLLKAKMENMNLSKKPKKPGKLKVRPPVAPRPCSGSLSSARHHRTFRVLPQISHTSANASKQQQPAPSSSVTVPLTSCLSPISCTAVPSGTASGMSMLQKEKPCSNPTSRNTKLPFEVSRVEMDGSKLKRDSLYSSISVLSGLGTEDKVELQNDQVAMLEDKVVMDSPKPFPFNSLLPEPLSLDVSAQQEASLDTLGAVAEPMTVVPLLSQAVSSDSINTWSISTKIPQPDLQTPTHVPQPFSEFTEKISCLFRSREGPPIRPRSPLQTPPFFGISVDSLGRQPGVSRCEAQDVTMPVRKASDELLGSMSNTDTLASLAASGGRERLTGPCGLGSNASNIHLLQKLTPLQRAAVYTPSGILDSSSGPSSSLKRLCSPAYHLPPVKAPLCSKKKTSKHCFLCGKKTGLATSYQCRCGNNFCSMHRYAETHDCTYDYKSVGRRFLQKSNPIIGAPKLPKI
ncbi:AN1-type zinc finger protein 4 isoform X2 [Trichomycterus rosablanca]|uniref:AN1-type zinc finger protein 4 isoform X2 n=1 Tax=Trichomycterus rosablanca TaxID=2290929 RepID=UPI002F35E03E